MSFLIKTFQYELPDKKNINDLTAENLVFKDDLLKEEEKNSGFLGLNTGNFQLNYKNTLQTIIDSDNSPIYISNRNLFDLMTNEQVYNLSSFLMGKGVIDIVNK